MSPVSSGVRSHARSCVASRGHVCPAGTRLRASPGLIVTSLTFLSFFFLFYSCTLTSEGFQLLPRDESCE